VEIEIRVESGKDAGSDRTVEMVVALVRSPRADGATSIDPELLEVPVFLREWGFPESFFDFLPSRDFATAGEDGFRARCGFPSDAGILGTEREGTGHRVGPVGDEDTHGFGRGARGIAGGLGCLDRTRGRELEVGRTGDGGESEKRVEESHD
jgi:hypothetical protein